MKKLLREKANLIALIAILIIIVALELATRGESFALTPENLSNLSVQVTIISVLAVGMTYVILIGGVDLGVGSLMALFGVIYLLVQNALFESLHANMGEGAAIAIAIGVGVIFTFIIALIIGLFDGYMIGRFAIPSFVITLGILSAARGGSLLLSNATGLSDRTNTFKNFASWYIPHWPSGVLLAAALVLIVWSTWKDVQRRKQYNLAIDRAEVGSKIVLGALGIAAAAYVFLGHKGIPVFVAILCVIVYSASFVLRHLPLGRRLYALGGNEQAARLSGIDVFKLRMFVFTLMTLLSCVAGLLNAARSGGVSPGVTGLMAELDAIAAVVIGGTSLMGGIGTVEGSIVGSFIIGAIRNGMTLLGVDANWEYVVRGFIVILAVWFDIAAKKRN